MTHPDHDDVVVRRKRGTPTAVYVLRTASAPDQFLLSTRDEAVAQALAFAKRRHVRAWFTNDDKDFVLLDTLRTMATRTHARVDRTFTAVRTALGREITLSGTPAGSYSAWTVEHVYDKSLNAEIRVPGVASIVASTEDAAFARTCECIDGRIRHNAYSV